MRVSHKRLIVSILAILILAYGLWQARDYLRGPRIFLEAPSEGQVFEQSLISIRGQALDVSKFSLNGRAIFIDEEGNFDEKIILVPGVNYIEIFAEDKFGHQKKIERTVLLK